ncbi:MAG: class I SAM-dependent methyltransferase, partial [Clostridia bacterium]|nr:class I SAM-dependent methyltransferase [Clostridia bacterium]
MSFSSKILMAVNKLFPLPLHPFNTQAEGGMSYAEWQYERGEDTIKFYLEYTDKETMFGGKDVLDVGC